MLNRRGYVPPEKGKGSKLSAKQTRFIDEFMVDLNASKAVVRAGYKTTNPNRAGTLLKNHPLVKVEIEKRMDEKRIRNEISADYLVNKLINIIEETETSNPTAALRAIELAGKSIALWKDRQEISGPDGESIKMEQKVQEDVADFTRRLSRLADGAGKTGVVEFPKREGTKST